MWGWVAFGALVLVIVGLCIAAVVYGIRHPPIG